MTKINFEHLDESIALKESQSNILVVESSAIFAKIMYSLYNHEEYFKIYDDNYKKISEKKIIFILNPLQFNFNDRNIINLIYNHIINQINLEQEFKEEVCYEYQSLANKIINCIETVDNIEFEYNEELDFKDLFKMLGLSVNQDSVTSVFEKIQLIISILNELANNNLLIMMNLNMLLTENEYKYVIEQIELNSQTVLIIESNSRNLKGITHYILDSDFCLRKACYNK